MGQSCLALLVNGGQNCLSFFFFNFVVFCFLFFWFVGFFFFFASLFACLFVVSALHLFIASSGEVSGVFWASRGELQKWQKK